MGPGEHQSAQSRPASAERSSVLEDFDVKGEVLLWVFANRSHQAAGFGEHLVGIVVKRRIAHKLAESAFSVVCAVQNRVQFGDRVVQLLSEGLILGQQAQAAFAGVYVRQELVGVGNAGVEVVVKGVILE